MNLIPAIGPLPVYAGTLKFFLLLFFMIHILLMNVLLGGSLISLFSKPETGMQKEREKMPVLFALTVNFGVAALLFLQVLYGRFVYVGAQLSAVYWLSIVGFVIIAYYAAYILKYNSKAGEDARRLLTGVIAVNLLVVGFFLTNTMTLMQNPSVWDAYFSRPGGTILNIADPVMIPRYLHFVAASIAAGGLFMAAAGAWKQKKTGEDAESRISQGMKWFLYATLAQVAVGFWFQLALPKPVMRLFLGGSLFHTLLFVIALLLVIQTIVFALKKNVGSTVGSFLVLVFSMIHMRDLVRTAYLEPYIGMSDAPVSGQFVPLVLFISILLVCVALMIHTVRLGVRAGIHKEAA